MDALQSRDPNRMLDLLIGERPGTRGFEFSLLCRKVPVVGSISSRRWKREKEGDTFTVKRYPGQVHGFMFSAKLLLKAYDAIEDVASVLRANQ